MTTKLGEPRSRAVKRETRCHCPDPPRNNLMIELCADGLYVRVWQKGCRSGKYLVPLVAVWHLGARMAAEQRRIDRARKRAERRSR